MFIHLFERGQTLRSFTTPKFRKCLSDLPPTVQKKSQETYKKWLIDPASVDFRQLKGKKNVWRVSICGGDWRAVGLVKDDTINWFWIGSHNDYENLIKTL